MARDYAPRGGGSRQTRNRKEATSSLPGWVWLVAGLSVGLAVAAFVYIGRPATTLSGQRTAAQAAAVEAEADAQRPASKKKAREPVQLPPREKARFTFYELLPNQEVIVPRDDPKDARAGAAPAGNDGTYFIQVASYRSQPEAERQKASLALLGVESRIETVTIDGKDTFYRVRVGPEHDLDRVKLIVGRLESNKIEAMVVRVK
ncbi:MAG TPA: SPOR domain-containing protein [Solimonas sp.]|nr:SPOR domain-containing protein [Solimonas sp.]